MQLGISQEGGKVGRYMVPSKSIRTLLTFQARMDLGIDGVYLYEDIRNLHPKLVQKFSNFLAVILLSPFPMGFVDRLNPDVPIFLFLKLRITVI